MATFGVIPMLRAPESWPVWAIGAAAMVALAALDIAGALAAKHWAATSGVLPLAAGVASFLAMFYVYASALKYTELALVTLGWIVILQVALVLIDHFLYGVHMGADKWVAVVVILAAQGYLMLAPTTDVQV